MQYHAGTSLHEFLTQPHPERLGFETLTTVPGSLTEKHHQAPPCHAEQLTSYSQACRIPDLSRFLSTNFRWKFCTVYFTTSISQISCEYVGYVTPFVHPIRRASGRLSRTTLQVSRSLNGISHCRDVWSDAYRRAGFIRPPGPFLSQSAHDLEDALVCGSRVDWNLRNGGGTAQRPRPTLKLREIRYTGVDIGVNLVFGRFLFIAFAEEVRCYDLNLDVLDSNSGASIIYRSTGGTLRSFHCVSAINIEGRPFACVVLSEETQTTTQMWASTFDAIQSPH